MCCLFVQAGLHDGKRQRIGHLAEQIHLLLRPRRRMGQTQAQNADGLSIGDEGHVDTGGYALNLEGLGAGSGDYMDVWDLNYRKNRPTVEAIDEAAALLEVELELGGERLGTSASTFFLFHIPAVTVDWSWFERDDHPDFHLPTDTADKIREDGLLQVTKVVAAATWELSR